ncbi:hypothetical protein EEJ37_09425 [Vibrio cholerae]|nr:hypothetical protein EEJ37_09425 [Vibrio cholerae]
MTTKKPANFAGFFIRTTYPKKVATIALQLHMAGVLALKRKQADVDRSPILFVSSLQSHLDH